MYRYEKAATRAARRVFRKAGLKQDAINRIYVYEQYDQLVLDLYNPDRTILTGRTRRMIKSSQEGALKAAKYAAMSASYYHPTVTSGINV